MATDVVNVPRYEANLFSDDVLDDPYPHLRALRDAGPLAWLPAHGMYAATRYEEVRRILGDSSTFVSGEGVALNDVINSLGRGTTLMSDGEEHRIQREIIGRPLTPRSLADLRSDAQAIVDAFVDRLVGRRLFTLLPISPRCCRRHGFLTCSAGPPTAVKTWWTGLQPSSTGSVRSMIEP